MASNEETVPSNEGLKNTIPLMTISGAYFPAGNFTEESIRETINFKPDPDDILLVTYPKSGTTWVQYIIWSIVHKGEAFPELWDMMTNHIPFLEMSGVKVVEGLEKPRIMKTHLDFERNPYHPKAKYIYVARNAKDVCISYYHFVKQVDPNFKDGTFDDFFELYVEGKIGYGGWYDNVYSWYIHKDDPNVLFLTYEWMKENHTEAVLKIASFLGKEYRDNLDQDPSLLKKIVESTTFQAMKKMPVKKPQDTREFSKTSSKKEDISNKTNIKEPDENMVFFRKGVVGDWKNYLSKSQERRLNEKLMSESEITSVMSVWGDLWTIDDLLENC